jgi:hypothetical protein
MGVWIARRLNLPMTEAVLYGILVLGLIDAAVLYATILSRRVHERRINARIDETRHLSAVLRADLALHRGVH